VQAALHEALAQDALPQFRADVPERLPAAVLLSRGDVAGLSGELAARGQGTLSLDGWIGPAPAPPAVPALQTGLPPRSPDETVRQAGAEVGWTLHLLAEARTAAEADVHRVNARRLELMAARQRAEAGDGGPTDVLELYLRYLADADTAAQSQGTLALAWAALHRQAPGAWQALRAAPRP
jgi:outer membrane protein TolC